MNWFWLVFFVFILLIVMILFSPIHAKLTVRRKQRDDVIDLHIKGIYGLVRRRIYVPALTLNNLKEGVTITFARKKKKHQPKKIEMNIPKLKRYIQQIQVWTAQFFHFSNWFKRTAKKMVITNFVWKTSFSTNKADETNTLVGIAWGIKGFIAGFFCNHFTLKKTPHIEVNPLQEEFRFEMEIHVTGYMRFYTLLFIALQLFIRYIKGKKLLFRKIKKT